MRVDDASQRHTGLTRRLRQALGLVDAAGPDPSGEDLPGGPVELQADEEPFEAGGAGVEFPP